MPATVVLGAQWGDEGKGKLVDRLAEEATIVARRGVACNGSAYGGLRVCFTFHLLNSLFTTLYLDYMNVRSACVLGIKLLRGYFPSNGAGDTP